MHTTYSDAERTIQIREDQRRHWSQKHEEALSEDTTKKYISSISTYIQHLFNTRSSYVQHMLNTCSSPVQFFYHLHNIMQIIISNQALQHAYILAQQHKEKTPGEIMKLDRMFDAIEDSVKEFEVQVKKMQKQGEELTQKTQNTAVKEKDRAEAQETLNALDKEFESIHFQKVALDLQKETVEMMKHIVEVAIDGEKIAGRRNVKCTSEVLFACDEYLAKNK